MDRKVWLESLDLQVRQDLWALLVPAEMKENKDPLDLLVTKVSRETKEFQDCLD